MGVKVVIFAMCNLAVYGSIVCRCSIIIDVFLNVGSRETTFLETRLYAALRAAHPTQSVLQHTASSKVTGIVSTRDRGGLQIFEYRPDYSTRRRSLALPTLQEAFGGARLRWPHTLLLIRPGSHQGRFECRPRILPSI